MAKMTPTVRGEVLVYQRDQHEQVLTVGTTDWYAWLETASSFAFVSQAGSFTARRERSGHGRGDWYWRAYRKQQGKLLSRYMEKSLCFLARKVSLKCILATLLVLYLLIQGRNAACSRLRCASSALREASYASRQQG